MNNPVCRFHISTYHQPAINFLDDPPHNVFDSIVVYFDNAAPIVERTVSLLGTGDVCCVMLCYELSKS